MGPRPAIRYRRFDRWQALSFADLRGRVSELTLGFRAAGVTKDDRVVIMAENGPESIAAELAVIACRAVAVILYPTYSPPVLRAIIDQVAPRLAVVESGPPLARYLEARQDAGDRIKVISYGDGVPGPRGEIRGLNAVAADGRRRLERCRAEGTGDPFVALVERTRRSDPIALAYTAGATGPPRGAILTHENFVPEDFSRLFGPADVDDVALIQIPIAQPFARLTACYGLLAAGATIAFQGSGDRLFDAIGQLAPTMLFLSPAAIQPLESVIKQRATRLPNVARRVIGWALESSRRARAERQSRPPWLLNHLILSRLRARLGGRIRFVYVGGAADGTILSFFQDLGIDTYEGCALAEATPLVALSRPEGHDPGRYDRGVVGRPAPGVEVDIDRSGEIRVRGLVLMKGYWRDQNATRAALDVQGWLRTGDVGYVNKHGFLVIEDRKADMIRLADARHVAPAIVESVIEESPLIDRAVVIGRGRPYPIALVVPDFKELARRVYRAQPELAKQATRVELLSNVASRVAVETEILAQSVKLPDFARPRKARLLAFEFSQGSELTPAGDLRRVAIEEKYAAQIEAVYHEDEEQEALAAAARGDSGPVVGEDTAEMRLGPFPPA